jgi:hypothetical protein
MTDPLVPKLQLGNQGIAPGACTAIPSFPASRAPRSEKKSVIPGAMNDSSNLNRPGLRHIKYEIVSDYQHSISKFSQAIISGRGSEVRIVCQRGNCIIKLLKHGSGSRGIILHDVVENVLQVSLHWGQVLDFIQVAHSILAFNWFINSACVIPFSAEASQDSASPSFRYNSIRL